MSIRSLFPAAVLLAAVAPAFAAEPTKEQLAFFEAKVRPLLAETCYKCHSVHEGKAKGGLTLDTREGWAKGGDTGPAIVPGDPDKSLLITAIGYHDADLQMPPKGEKLTDQQIADLTTWVKMGAPDPRKGDGKGSVRLSGLNDKAREHWAFQQVKKPTVPEPKTNGWGKTPVDSFILAKLEANGMKPAALASKETLLRRATYDLTGLPPTPEELKAFIEDTSPDAFAKVVDRLLASPHYGERWGRYWLDSARYSDTTGGERNLREEYRYPYAWTYRDYVIQAFNEDKPYDQFLLEQIAADKLPDIEKDRTRLAALGFLTVGQRFRNIHDTINERIDTLTKATQALTVSCARCHDHTFDPIPTADFYSLHGIFASSVEPKEKPLLSHTPDDPQLRDFEKKLEALEQKNRDKYYGMMEQWLGEFRSKTAPYLMAAKLTRGGRRVTTNEQVKERNRIMREHKLDEDLVRRIARSIRRDDPVLGVFFRFGELPEEKFAERAKGVVQEIATGKGMGRRGRVNELVKASFSNSQPQSLKEVVEIYAKLFVGIEEPARKYLEACRTATSETVEGFDAELARLIQTPLSIEPASQLTTDALLAAIPQLPFRNNRGMNAFAFAEINELKLTHPGAPARAMVLTDAPQPRNSPIFIRGEAQSRGEIVPRRYLEIISGKDRKPFTNGSGRLELAQAIASKENPLTARVMINRIWMRHFGEGFVRTLDDLGVQSEPPSHPELLDYLAARFMEEGWSIKKIHRLIMLSSAYQQSSDTNAEYALKDPENRLLWRANIRRLDFEAIRDSMLAFSGKLERTLGGKPINLTDEPYSYRRSVYGYIDRGNLPELMAQFDFSDPEMTNSKRATTIVPQQALFFMNSPMCVDVARKAVSRPEFTDATDDAGRVRALYQLLFQREPRKNEVAFAQEFLTSVDAEDADEASVQFASLDGKAAVSAKKAKRAMKKKKKNVPKPKNNRRRDGSRAIMNEGEFVERKPLTAWEQYAQALLFTNEMAYVD